MPDLSAADFNSHIMISDLAKSMDRYHEANWFHKALMLHRYLSSENNLKKESRYTVQTKQYMKGTCQSSKSQFRNSNISSTAVLSASCKKS